MYIRTLSAIFITLILCIVMVFTDFRDPASLNDRPITVVTLPDYTMKYEQVPEDITDIIKTLDFKDADKVDPGAGYTAALKIEMFDVSSYVEYADGWLIASARGEWGGIVFWVSKTGEYEVIKDDNFSNPIELIIDQNSVFIIQAMKHVRYRNGHLLEITRDKGAFHKKVYPLNGNPIGFSKREGEWTVQLRSKQFYNLSELRDGKDILHP